MCVHDECCCFQVFLSSIRIGRWSRPDTDLDSVSFHRWAKRLLMTVSSLAPLGAWLWRQWPRELIWHFQWQLALSSVECCLVQMELENLKLSRIWLRSVTRCTTVLEYQHLVTSICKMSFSCLKCSIVNSSRIVWNKTIHGCIYAFSMLPSYRRNTVLYFRLLRTML